MTKEEADEIVELIEQLKKTSGILRQGLKKKMQS